MCLYFPCVVNFNIFKTKTKMISVYFFSCCLIFSVVGINRSVYKVSITQKGYAQFLEYDVEIPPLKEFTFCTWIRVFSLDNDQTIFSYVGKSRRAARLWLESGGTNLKMSINDQILSSIPVEWHVNVWRHICMSYQSDFGAWAVYVDGSIVQCEANRKLLGYILPAGGSIIIGYGTSDRSSQIGLEGEIFGFSMILTSTIGRNYSLKTDSKNDQKLTPKNKLAYNRKMNYVILGDLDTAKTADFLQESEKSTISSTMEPTSRNYIKFSTPYSVVDHIVGHEVLGPHLKNNVNMEMDILDFPPNEKKMSFWNFINKSGKQEKQLIRPLSELSKSETEDLPTISSIETPPPPGSVNKYDNNNNVDINKYNHNQVNQQNTVTKSKVPTSTPNLNKGLTPPNIADIEIPPPYQKKNNVFGQWSSSSFAANVLNHLKTLNYYKRVPKKIPATIPLTKLSETYPYASDFKPITVRPNFQVQRQKFASTHFKIKRDTINPVINVQIEETDIREDILKSHAQTQPRQVKITNRGETKRETEHRYYRNVDHQASNEQLNSQEDNKPRPFRPKTNLLNYIKSPAHYTLRKPNTLLTVLPFLKSFEYYMHNIQRKENITDDENIDMYSKSLSNGNKWHNVKSYSNDYTPRHLNVKTLTTLDNLNENVAQANIKAPSVRVNYKYGNQKVIISNVNEKDIIKGRNVAADVANQSNPQIRRGKNFRRNKYRNNDRSKNIKDINREKYEVKSGNRYTNKNNFNKNVKIGNALDEHAVIGLSENEKRRSFIGGDDKIPDINRYRSNLDDYSDENIPPSLGPPICYSGDSRSHTLYVQSDGTIDVSSINSPIKSENMASNFITENYQHCSLVSGPLENNPELLIEWNTTPVRLFGGAYPKRTKDLCGFF